MNAWRIFRWVLWRGVLSGTVLGAMFLYVGIFYGAVMGAIFGTVNGIALLILTHIAFTPCHNLRRYRWSVLLVSVACTIATSLLYALGIDASPEITLALTLVTTITAAVFAWRLPDALFAHIEESRHPHANAVLFYIEK